MLFIKYVFYTIFKPMPKYIYTIIKNKKKY